ncbi:MAG: hypothetical protein U1E36_00695 [Rickettsiales bacterium]
MSQSEFHPDHNPKYDDFPVGEIYYYAGLQKRHDHFVEKVRKMEGRDGIVLLIDNYYELTPKTIERATKLLYCITEKNAETFPVSNFGALFPRDPEEMKKTVRALNLGIRHVLGKDTATKVTLEDQEGTQMMTLHNVTADLPVEQIKDSLKKIGKQLEAAQKLR